MKSRTQIAIVGAGPAGLLLGNLLHLAGIDSVIVENRSRDYVLDRVRAGVVEQGTVDLCAMGVSAGLNSRGLRHEGIYLSFEARRHRVDTGRPLYFDVQDVPGCGRSGGRPSTPCAKLYRQGDQT
jgi:p-hydroxybenzoate 3-monooxygenase